MTDTTSDSENALGFSTSFGDYIILTQCAHNTHMPFHGHRDTL